MSTEIRTEAERSASPARADSRYRPHLDGLRTVAVYLVVAFHSGLGLLSGGFIGVDIFFVLSGFLVTQILMRDLGSLGRIRGRQFYARRARRILPAAVLALTGTALAYSIVASPAEMLDALGGFRASLFYVANWFFIHQATDYFAANINSNPALHFWSLAVEEQFYLLWPMLLGGLFLVSSRVGRRRWWVLRTVVAATAVASAIAALHLATTNLSRAYYGTDTRAYQLLAGAALALTPQLLRFGSSRWPVARWTTTLALAGLLLLATSVVDCGPITRGVLVAVLAIVLLVSLENAGGGIAKRVLSSRPFTYLGRISYGVYLWHWPVIVIAAHGRHLNPITLFVISCFLATPLAAISFHLVERPIRASPRLDRYKLPVIAIGLATSVVVGVVVMPAILDRGSGTLSALPGGNGSPSGVHLLDWRVAKKDIAKLPSCLGRPVQQCTVVTGTGLRVLLMGDSHAQMWIPTFTEIAKRRGWTFSVASSPTCPWQDHLLVLYPTLDECRAQQADWYDRVIPKLDPELIILSHQPLDNPEHGFPMIGLDGRVVYPGAKQESVLTKASSASLHTLARPGRKLVIIEPVPDVPPGTNPLSCLSLGGDPEKCAYKAARQLTPLERFYRVEARKKVVFSVDLDRVVCPRWPTCDAIVGDIIVKRDSTHLTATFARSLASQVGALLPK